MTNTQSHAKREMEILSKSHPDKDNRPLIEPFQKEILALCEKFGNSGQSGGSAPYTATAISQAIKKLLLQEPICPITGIEEEWNDVTEMSGYTLYQNNRCSAVFREGDTKAYYLDAIVFKGENGHTFTGNSVMTPDNTLVGSHQYIKEFPFTPKTFYIDVFEQDLSGDGDWVSFVKDEKQLEKVWKYYDRYTLKEKPKE